MNLSLPRRRTSTQLRRDLASSCGDGSAFGVMVGLGETYLPAFALAMGLGDLVAGMIGSLPLLLGGMLQMISPWAIVRLGSHKKWVVLCSAVQAMTFLPLIWSALNGTITPLSILLIASIYWGAGLAAGPAWNTWIGTLVPAVIRPRYFASRTRFSQACVFAGFLVAGLALQYGSASDDLLITYAWLFAISGVFRMISVWMLILHSEPTPLPSTMQTLPFRELFRLLANGPGARLLGFLVAVQAAVQMAGPYFTPFMFNQLEHSYFEFMVLIAAAFLGRILSLHSWGIFAKRLGAQRLLWIGALGIAPVSLGWVVSQDFYWLLAIQVVSGAFWAAYELAFFLMYFESLPPERRTGMLTVYNLINTAAWVTGSLVGGIVLFSFSTSFTGYLVVFTLSAVGRFLALFLLARLGTVDVEGDEIGFRTISVRPNGASLDSPILSSMPDQIPDLDEENG